MCFRVVRVQGDGSIKITLADRDHECNSSDYNRSLADSAFISADRYSYKNNPERKNNDFSFNASDALSYVNS